MSPQPHRGRTGKRADPAAGKRAAAKRTARPTRAKEPARDVHDPDGVRLQKLLAQAGVGSRRACEELIAAGRVMVDDQVVRELGVRVDPSGSVIHVDGLRIQLDESKVYLAINKPLGVVSTMDDERGRPWLGPTSSAQRKERLFHVGPARHRHRGPPAADQRRRAGPPAAAPVVRRAQDLPRRDPRAGGSRRRAAAARGHRARGRHGRRSTASASSTPSRARRSSRWSCTRASTTSYAACWRRSATRCCSWCGPRSGRSGWESCARARCASLTPDEVGRLYAAVGL